MPTTETPGGEQPRAPTLLRGKLWFWLPVPVLVGLDLWSKSAAFAFLAARFPAQVEERRCYTVGETPWLTFHLVSWPNTGTLWGIGRSWNLPLVILRSVAVVVLVWYARRTSARARAQLLLLGIILAGALGNLYDNLTQPDGGVRDFLRFQGQIWDRSWSFPAFNVADSCISMGALALALLLWRGQARERSRPPAPSRPAAT